MFNLFGLKDIIAIGVALALSLYIGILKIEITQVKADNLALTNQIVSFEAVAKASVAQAEAKKEIVIKEVEVIKWKTKTKVETIKEYVYDTNKSDCANAMDFARSYF